MQVLRKCIWFFCVLATTTASTSLALRAQETDGTRETDGNEWATALTQQLMRQESCVMVYMTNVKTFELAGREIISARAHCEDGRRFDVERTEGDLLFKATICGPVAC